ncbi:MAG: AraC family transcriptional regulator [Thermodesulfobacteriota bacterium]|nr:AraC family transcriptional regulator [Thermodesulfobacteriota bacterium]
MYLTKLASIQQVLWNILEKYNVDPEPVFKQVQLNPALMHEPGARYSLKKIEDLWDEMGRRIEDPCFGLSAATCWHPTYFGTMGYAMLVSKSLRVSLERLIRFHRVISDADFGELHEDRNAGALVFTLKYQDESHYSRAREDAALAWLMSLLRVNFQKDLTPVSVHLTHSKPDCSRKYYEFFQSPVHFDSSLCRLALSLDVVDRLLPSGNEEFAKFGDQAMTAYLASLDKGHQVTHIKKIIIDNMPSGNVTVEQVAGELGLNSRKLQRILQKKGTTFLSLLNETRMDIAKDYIQDKNIDLTEIAFLLGFAELSTFSRSFKRWTGKSPIQFRKTA